MISVDRSLLCVISLRLSLGDAIVVGGHLLLALSQVESLYYYSRTLVEWPFFDLHEADDFGMVPALESCVC